MLHESERYDMYGTRKMHITGEGSNARQTNDDRTRAQHIRFICTSQRQVSRTFVCHTYVTRTNVLSVRYSNIYALGWRIDASL